MLIHEARFKACNSNVCALVAEFANMHKTIHSRRVLRTHPIEMLDQCLGAISTNMCGCLDPQLCAVTGGIGTHAGYGPEIMWLGGQRKPRKQMGRISPVAPWAT